MMKALAPSSAKSLASAALAATPVGAKPVASPFAGAEYAKFYETPPAENQDGARTWYARG
jgi:hypothetical protein